MLTNMHFLIFFTILANFARLRPRTDPNKLIGPKICFFVILVYFARGVFGIGFVSSLNHELFMPKNTHFLLFFTILANFARLRPRTDPTKHPLVLKSVFL